MSLKTKIILGAGVFAAIGIGIGLELHRLHRPHLGRVGRNPQARRTIIDAVSDRTVTSLLELVGRVHIMITELSAQNFKSWKDTGKLLIAPLTGFFGANSSGKTSILQTLLMLKQTVERPPDWNGVIDFGDDSTLVNLGNFDDLIHQHSLDLNLGIIVSWNLSEKQKLDSIETDSLSFLNVHC